MGAKISIQKDQVSDAKLALNQASTCFGKAAEGNHPLLPHMFRLDYEDLPRHKEREFADVCRRLGIGEVVFYDTRVKPYDPGLF